MVLQVFVAAAFTDLATGLGAVPFWFVRTLHPRWQGVSYATAGGMMISAAVFSLANQGLGRGQAWQTVAGLLAGAGFYWVAARRVKSHEHWRIESLSTRDSQQAVLMLTTMFIHSIPEGIAVGVGFATGEIQFGLLLSVAIAVHNIPEGIAISLPLRAKGVSATRCAAYAILSSVPQPVAAVPAYMLVEVFRPLLPLGLGFAGGAMIFLVAAELIPDSLELCSRDDAAWGVMVGLVMMLVVTASLGLMASNSLGHG